jgi:hypothetical protein
VALPNRVFGYSANSIVARLTTRERIVLFKSRIAFVAALVAATIQIVRGSETPTLIESTER